MRPTIEPGEEVALACGAAFGEGDVVAYVRGDRLVLHRVLRLRPDRGYMVTRGDALVLPDALVTELAGVLGTVRGVRRGGELVPLAGAPSSLARRVALRLWLAALVAGPVAGRRIIQVLLAARPLLRLARRLTGSARPRPPQASA